MKQFKKHLLYTLPMIIGLGILMIKNPNNSGAFFGDITATGVLNTPRAIISTMNATAQIGFQNGSTFTAASITSPLMFNSTLSISPGSFNIDQGSFSMKNGTFTVFSPTVTFANPQTGYGSTVTLGAIQFNNENLIGGKKYIQRNPGFELLGSSVINAAISTVTVSFSSTSYIYAVFSGSCNVGPFCGDLLVLFNNTKKDNIFSVMRNTMTIGQNDVRTSSLSAIGITVFGESVSTNTDREFRMSIRGNDLLTPKRGSIFAVAGTTATEAEVRSEVGFSWYNNNAQITSISVTQIASGGQGGGAAVFRRGAFLAVYGNTFTEDK